MPELDTAAIRARLDASLARDLWHPALDDVKALLAEVERLTSALALEKHETSLVRDARGESMADVEHWQTCAEAAEAALARVRALLDWPVGRSTSGVDRLVPATDIAAALDGAHPTPSDGSES